MGRILIKLDGRDMAQHLMMHELDLTHALEAMAGYDDAHMSWLADGIARSARRDDAKDITDFLRNLAEKIEKAAG